MGSNPSRNNIDVKKAFAGTRSGVILDDWVRQLSITNAVKINVSDDVDFDGKVRDQEVAAFRKKLNPYLNKTKIIALGRVAEKYLEECGVVGFFSLPHPSPRNRALNDKNKLAAKISACHQWLSESSTRHKEIA